MSKWILVLFVGIGLFGCSGAPSTRDQIAYRSSCEGRIAEAQKALVNHQQSSKFSPASETKNAVMTELEGALKKARVLLEGLTADSSDWDKKKAALDEAVTAVEQVYAKTKTVE